MEHTVTIVTRQSAITDIQRVLHTRIPHIHTHTLKLTNIQSSYYIVDLRNKWIEFRTNEIGNGSKKDRCILCG